MSDYIKRLAGPYTGAGQTTFTFGFFTYQAKDIYVGTAMSNDGAATILEQDVDYSVSLNDDQNATPGGSITLLNGTGLKSGESLVIGSSLDPIKNIELTNYSRFPPEQIDKEFNRIFIILQQIYEENGRTFKVPATSSETPDDMIKRLFIARDDAKKAADEARKASEVAQGVAEKVKEYSWDIPHLVNSVEDVERYPHDGYFWVKGFGNPGQAGSDISNRLVNVAGGQRTLGSKLSDIVSVKDFGAKGDGVTDDTGAFNVAVNELKRKGGGTIYVPEGTYRARGILLSTGIHFLGAGKGTTTIKKPSGSTEDVFITEGFTSFTGVGPAIDAPHHFSVKDLTVDGNYLTDWKTAILYGDSRVSCRKGYGFRIFGTCYDIDVELINCPEIGFYSEVVYGDGYSLEHASSLKLQGRVFGKEAVIYRGPADCELGPIFLGAPGFLPTQAERNSTIVMSDVFPGEPVHCFVSDESYVNGESGAQYSGHHEFNIMHLYGNANGYGYCCMNTGRIKGNHLICEGCRGGFKGASRNWGGIALLDCHNNVRLPRNLIGTVPLFYDIHNLSQQSFYINAVVRHNMASVSNNPIALRDESKSSQVNLIYSVAGTQDPTQAFDAPIADIKGNNSVFNIVCKTTKGNAVIVDGSCNEITVNAEGHTGGALVKRLGGDSFQNANNTINITSRDCSAVFEMDKLIVSERWDISAVLKDGQVLNGGEIIFDMYNRAVLVNVSARIGNASVCSRDVGRVNLDNTTIESQTITVNHIYFQKPEVSQIKTSVYDPDPLYGGKLEYLYVSDVTDTTITFRYKLSSTGSGGPLVLLWDIY